MSPSFLDLTLGPIVNATLIITFILGVVTMQAYTYIRSFPNDTIILKSLVTAIWFMQLAFTTCLCQGVYTMTVTYFGQVLHLLRIPVAMTGAVVIGILIAHSVQIFFIYRIYKFSRALYVSITLWFFAACLHGISLTAAAEVIKLDSIPLLQEEWKWLFTFLFVGDAALDLLIAATLCFYLKKQIQSIPLRNTTILIDRLLSYTIQTGLVTSLVAVAAAVMFIAMPENYMWTAFFICMPGFFASALLANLNNRLNFRQPDSSVTSPSQAMNTFSRNSMVDPNISNTLKSEDVTDPTISSVSSSWRPHALTTV
ncbi:hypothetical protein B0H10DRAFT_2078182 [Mycena sp. CBHHK59/15]|nr:hypothetical protein B0H10DRAFT_2078182 [Mycena sp. CBHHK59/15]